MLQMLHWKLVTNDFVTRLCQIDLKKMPLGKLSKKQIESAYKVLTELQGVCAYNFSDFCCLMQHVVIISLERFGIVRLK